MVEPVNDDATPQGKLQVTVTCFEMTARPTRPPHPAPLKKLALLRAEQPTLHFYRYLYHTVDERWLWSDRRLLDDKALAALLADPRDRLYVLYCAGVPAGFAELFHRDKATTEVIYFGLMPEFAGTGLDTFLLDAIIDIAWQDDPERLTVETCTLDHPRALALYQRAGFVPVRQEVKIKDVPRTGGPIPVNRL